MSHINLMLTLERIKSASEASPIAVFTSKHPECLDAVFAITIMTVALIKAKDPRWVGTYHGGMDMRQVARELRDKIIEPQQMSNMRPVEEAVEPSQSEILGSSS